jgi:hypothetical protein
MSSMSPAGNAADPPRALAALEGIGTQLGRSYPSQAEAIERDRVLDRLAHLRKILPVFAEEMASARREAARLRAENSRLLEQVGQLQRKLVQGNHTVSTPTSASGPARKGIQARGPSAARPA